jgi:acyl carrier protein
MTIDNIADTELHARVKAVLQKVIYKAASLDNLSPESRLQEDLDMDSVRLVDLVLGLEDEFGIRIEDEAIENIKTFGGLMDLIHTKMR